VVGNVVLWITTRAVRSVDIGVIVDVLAVDVSSDVGVGGISVVSCANAIGGRFTRVSSDAEENVLMALKQ
jgi:hypothetical protein